MPFPTTQVALDSGDTSVAIQTSFKSLAVPLLLFASGGSVDQEESSFRVDASFLFFLFWYYGKHL